MPEGCIGADQFVPIGKPAPIASYQPAPIAFSVLVRSLCLIGLKKKIDVGLPFGWLAIDVITWGNDSFLIKRKKMCNTSSLRAYLKGEFDFQSYL